MKSIFITIKVYIGSNGLYKRLQAHCLSMFKQKRKKITVL
jgi:hypothetical protein